MVGCSACSVIADGGGWTNDIGVKGGEAVLNLLAPRLVLDISNSVPLRLPVGIEQLRVIAGGIGRGDGGVEIRGLLSNWLFETRGAEYPNALEDLAELLGGGGGGLGSTWSSLIFGVETNVGEAVGDDVNTFGNLETGLLGIGPEYKPGVEERGLLGNGLLVIGPEKDRLLSDPIREYKSPSVEGRGNREDVFLLLSLRTCSFKAVIGLEETFEGPRVSSGDECQMFFVIAFAGLDEVMWLVLPRRVIDEGLLADSTGVGNA